MKRIARRVARPVSAPIDGRVADINRRVGDARGAAERQGAILQDRLNQVANAIDSFALASAEATSYVGLELRRIEETLQDALEQTRLEPPAEYYQARLSHALDLPLEKLDADLASVLNHAASHRGFAAQAGLWFNPPVTVELHAGGAGIGSVNERIVEPPFAMTVLGRIPRGAQVLDIGSAESTFALSAAALGYRVTAVDLRPLPYSHPNLTSCAGRFEDWVAPTELFAAIFLISTIEHIGLGVYGDSSYGDRSPGKGADRALIERLSALLAPNGVLALTTPYGREAVSERQRTYDDESLGALLDGWNVLERWTIAQDDELTWLPESDARQVTDGVVLVLATPSLRA